MASTTHVEFENAIFDIPISPGHDINHYPNRSNEIVSKSSSSTERNESFQGRSSREDIITPPPVVDSTNHSISSKFNCLELSFLSTVNKSRIKGGLKVLTLIISVCIIIYLSSVIHLKNSSNRKCQMCGNPVTFPTFLGDLHGNKCKMGYLGSPNYDCGEDAACFKMDVVHSDDWKIQTDMIKDYIFQEGKWKDNPITVDPYINDGTFRGCMHGFFHWSGETNCHFFNSTTIGHNIEGDHPIHNNSTWFATTVCACTSNNCN